MDVNGARLHVELAGEGEAVVLLHAGITDLRMWGPQIASLKKQRRVIAYDRRGFGASTLPAGPFAHIDDLRALLDALGVGRAAFVGCSQGGGLALELALLEPGRVERLALVSSALGGFTTSPGMRARLDEIEAAGEHGGIDAVNELEVRLWVDGPRRRPDELDPEVRRLALEMNRAALALDTGQAQGRPLDPRTIERLGEVHQPTLVVTGELDEPDTLARCAILAARVPGARHVVVNGAAHLVGLERPDELNGLLATFLASGDPAVF